MQKQDSALRTRSTIKLVGPCTVTNFNSEYGLWTINPVKGHVVLKLYTTPEDPASVSKQLARVMWPRRKEYIRCICSTATLWIHQHLMPATCRFHMCFCLLICVCLLICDVFVSSGGDGGGFAPCTLMCQAKRWTVHGDTVILIEAHSIHNDRMFSSAVTDMTFRQSSQPADVC